MAKILSVTAECSDMCVVRFPNGEEIHGYVPKWLGIGGGDYVKFEVDVDTGQIVGWNQAIKGRIDDEPLDLADH